jgi:hypothetical protein
MKVYVCSDLCLTYSPELLNREHNRVVCDYILTKIKWGYTTIRNEAAYLKITSSLLTDNRITPEELIEFLTKAQQQLKNKEGYLSHKFNKFFPEGGSKRKPAWGPEPGTIKIFSRELVSFYDGRDWNKLGV